MAGSMAGEVVIARYSEDLEWVTRIPAEFSVTIYNKGAKIASDTVLGRAERIVELANSGRESDTFLRHILAKAEFTDGYTVFLQGDPFAHSPDLIALLAAWRSWRDLQPLSWGWLSSEKLPPEGVLLGETAGFIGGLRVRPETFSLCSWTALQFYDPGAKRICDDYQRLHGLPNGANIATDFLRRCEWTELAEQARTHLCGRFSYGALFAARQRLLVQAPRGSLELALEAANAHSMYGYVLERLWLHMFSEAFLLAAPEAAEASPASLPSRFVPPVGYGPRKPLHRRVIPGLKRRIVSWAQT